MQVLQDITEAEKRSDERIESAKKKAEQILKDAELSGRAVLEQKQREMAAHREQQLAMIRKKLQDDREQSQKEGKQEAKDLRAKASKNMDLAVDILYKEFISQVK